MKGNSDTHSDRYQRLQLRRLQAGCRSVMDRAGLTVTLDGAEIHDIPSLYLAIGEQLIGPSGYFGASLDALSDCLCGGFGVRLPLTVRLHNSHLLQVALDDAAWAAFTAETVCRLLETESLESLTEAGWFEETTAREEVAGWRAVRELANQPGDRDRDAIMAQLPRPLARGSYFDSFMVVLKEAGVTVSGL